MSRARRERYSMAPVVRNVDIFRRWITAACMVFIAFVCASCATTGRPFDASITAQGIVSRHAESAFDVWFDQELAKDREVLNRFFEATKDAQTKADLTRAWQAIRELDTEHPDFLEKRIFSKAAGDGDWPGSDPPLDQKEVFVNGVRQALNKFLEEVETPSHVEIPDLYGRALQQAKSVLPRELPLGRVTFRESDRPEGTIIDQNPRAGARVAPGTVVNVVKATSGAAPPVSPAVGISDRGTTLEALKWKLLAVGLGLILLILVIAVLIPHPTPFQYIVFRTTLALAAACVASALPGFFEFNPEVPKAGIAAGGALAVFVLVYMWNPGRIIGKNEENS